MVFEFGARYPELFAGYVCMSGRIENIPALIQTAHPPTIEHAQWLVTHGSEDRHLDPITTKEQLRTLGRVGFKITFREYPKGHTFDFHSELPFVRKWIKNKII